MTVDIKNKKIVSFEFPFNVYKKYKCNIKYNPLEKF